MLAFLADVDDSSPSRNVLARLLAASVVAGLNILVAGGTQAGKTTMLNCLSSSIPSRERVVTCDEDDQLHEVDLRRRLGRTGEEPGQRLGRRGEVKTDE